MASSLTSMEFQFQQDSPQPSSVSRGFDLRPTHDNWKDQLDQHPVDATFENIVELICLYPASLRMKLLPGHFDHQGRFAMRHKTKTAEAVQRRRQELGILEIGVGSIRSCRVVKHPTLEYLSSEKKYKVTTVVDPKRDPRGTGSLGNQMIVLYLAASGSVKHGVQAHIQERPRAPGPILWKEPTFGVVGFTDKEIETSLQRLSSWFLNYHQYAELARGKQHFRARPINELLYAHDSSSARPALASSWTLTDTVRRLLDVHDGVSIQEKVQSLELDFSDRAWITGVLAILLSDVIFGNASAYVLEDGEILRETLRDMGLEAGAIEMAVQDKQLRTIKAASKIFEDRLKSRQDYHVEQFNRIMFPLIGSDSQISSLHVDMVKTAVKLNLNFAAYSGRFEKIYPKMGDAFEPQDHECVGPQELIGPDMNPSHLRGRPILMIAMPGVRWKLTDQEGWIVRCRAKVHLWHGSL